MVWKFCGKARHSFARFTRNFAETVPFHKISTPGNQMKLRYFMQCMYQYIEFNVMFSSLRGLCLLKYFSCFPSQQSKKMVDMGITGPEGHEMCRPEEVRYLKQYLFLNSCPQVLSYFQSNETGIQVFLVFFEWSLLFVVLKVGLGFQSKALSKKFFYKFFLTIL